MTIDAATLVAFYAAIVATGALALEIRRWFETGPKIVVRATPNMTMLDGREQTKGILVVNVANRGDVPTTIKNFGILEYSGFWARWRDKCSQSFIVPHPQAKGNAPIVPFVLKPGEQWMGMAHPRPEVTGDLETGTFWAAIYTSDRDKPYLGRIRKRQAVPALENAKAV